MLGELYTVQDMPQQAVEVRGYADYIPLGEGYPPESYRFNYVDNQVQEWNIKEVQVSNQNNCRGDQLTL